MSIDTSFLERCIDMLDAAIGQMQDNEPNTFGYKTGHDVYTMEFERILEQNGKLLRKCLAEYFASNRKADALTFRDCFRHAAKHGIIDCATCERWLEYRNCIDQMNSNKTISDKALQSLSQFSADARALAATIKAANND